MKENDVLQPSDNVRTKLTVFAQWRSHKTASGRRVDVVLETERAQYVEMCINSIVCNSCHIHLHANKCLWCRIFWVHSRLCHQKRSHEVGISDLNVCYFFWPCDLFRVLLFTYSVGCTFTVLAPWGLHFIAFQFRCTVTVKASSFTHSSDIGEQCQWKQRTQCNDHHAFLTHNWVSVNSNDIITSSRFLTAEVNGTCHKLQWC